MIGKYCGDSIPPSHVSSSNEVLIHFQSDGSVTYGGFKMEYNPTGNTSIQNNTEYYGDYYREILEYYSPGPIVALLLFLNMLQLRFFFITMFSQISFFAHDK